MGEQHYMSKVPLKLVLLFLANLILIIALELLLVYRYPAALNEEVLASYDSAYQGATILEAYDVSRLHCYLVKTETGELHLIPASTHGIFFGRSRILNDQITVIPADAAETIVTLKLGIHSSTVTVTRQEISGTSTYAVRIQSGQVSSVNELASYYMLITALLELVELFIIYKLKGTI